MRLATCFLYKGQAFRYGPVCFGQVGAFTRPESLKNMQEMFRSAVYSNGRQFDSIDDQKEALVFMWDRIDKSLLQNLVPSMIARVVSLIEPKEGITLYSLQSHC